MTAVPARQPRRAFLLALAAAITAVAALAAIAGARSLDTPQNTSTPVIDGSTVVGQTLAVSNGAWSGSPTSYSYQWQRCDQSVNGCVNISGADNKTYALQSADAGRRLVALVTAANSSGKATVNSKPTEVVSTSGAAQSTARPSITGTPKVGEELVANRGTWNSATSSFAYQWQRCDQNGANCASINGATGRTYGVRTADAGHTIRVVVTGTGSSGSATATSDRTNAIQALAQQTPQPADNNPCSKLAASAASSTVAANDLDLPNRLMISNVEFAPNVLRSRNTFSARFRVMDSCGRPVQGALVYATGIPFGKVQNAPEVATDAQGWATIQFTPTTRLPLVKGTALQMFVRARKAGQNVLAGISTRRLVQIGISS
jgi:hypothetical protein